MKYIFRNVANSWQMFSAIFLTMGSSSNGGKYKVNMHTFFSIAEVKSSYATIFCYFMADLAKIRAQIFPGAQNCMRPLYVLRPTYLPVGNTDIQHEGLFETPSCLSLP
jgi:hypothetical protein